MSNSPSWARRINFSAMASLSSSLRGPYFRPVGQALCQAWSLAQGGTLYSPASPLTLILEWPQPGSGFHFLCLPVQRRANCSKAYFVSVDRTRSAKARAYSAAWRNSTPEGSLPAIMHVHCDSTETDPGKRFLCFGLFVWHFDPGACDDQIWTAVSPKPF